MRTDDDQWGTLYAENVIANCSVRAFVSKCRNDVINNVSVNVKLGGPISMPDEWGPFTGSRVERNIFIQCVDHPALFYFNFPNVPTGDYTRLKGTSIDKNIYFNAYAANRPGIDFQAMRAEGLEAHSLLVNPALMDWRNGDFRLRKDSPAHKLGILSLDIRKMGLPHT